MSAHRKHPPSNAAETIESLASQGHAIIGIAKKLGVSKETFKRWCEEDGALQEAFEIGRETERQALHALIVQSAVSNKPANVNAFFILKARHGYRENDSPNANVNLAVAVAPVLVIHDHGDDETWAKKAAEQQRNLVLNATSPPTPVVTQEQLSVPLTYPAPAWMPPQLPQAVPVASYQPQPHQYDAPAWKQNS
jgi:hypothetical protein